MAKKKPVTKARGHKPPARKALEKKKKPTTALAKRTTVNLEQPIPVAAVSSLYLTENPLSIEFPTHPVKFTKQEVAILSEKVDQAEIRMKPTGQPYLSHTTYTRWFNRAFGIGTWHLRPLAMPTKKTTETGAEAILIPYAFYVRGVPVATAWGEHEYYPKNKDQSLGDAVESTHASALRRCAKRLGMSLEMWDREYLDRFVEAKAICVRVKRMKWNHDQKKMVPKISKEWRLRDSHPFAGELGPVGLHEDDDYDQTSQPQRQPRQPPPAAQERTTAPAQRPVANYPSQDQAINELQRESFWRRVESSGRSKAEVAEFLRQDYGLTSSHYIKRRDYENIMAAIEHPGPLRRAIDVEFRREPGEEG